MKNSHDSEVPAQGQQIITACAFISHTFSGIEKVFLPKRAKTKKFLPDVFEMPGGHIDWGENIVDGLKREVEEEFGVSIAVGDPFAVFDYVNEVKGSHSVEIVYFAKFIDPIENITLNPEDHSEFIWFDGQDFDLIVNDVKGKDDPEIACIKKGFELIESCRQF
jgi:ADP-ribose pyrophosphatase YjhB (NUDIX family)